MSRSLFRSLLVAYAFLSLMGGICDLVFPELVPASLRDADDALLDSLSRQFTIVVSTAAVFILVIQIVATAGCFFFVPGHHGLR